MSREVKDKEQENNGFSIWERRKRPIVFVALTLILIAFILSIINLIYWGTYLPLVSFLIPFMFGVAFILLGIEIFLSKNKEYKMILFFGCLICILALIPYVKYLF